MDLWKAWWSHCCRMSQRKRLEPSLSDYVIGWYFIKDRLETRRELPTLCKLYKTRHMISKYHLKLLKNNNVDGDIFKHLASLPPSLRVTFSPPFPHSLLLPCALVTLVIFPLLKGVCCFLPNAAHVLLSSPLAKYRSSTSAFFSRGFVVMLELTCMEGEEKKKVVTYCNCI